MQEPIISKKEIVQKEKQQVALSNAMVEIILENMEIERQKLIVKMLIWGYKKIEIRNQLDITNYRFQKELKNIRNIINQIYFDKENIGLSVKSHVLNHVSAKSLNF